MNPFNPFNPNEGDTFTTKYPCPTTWKIHQVTYTGIGLGYGKTNHIRIWLTPQQFIHFYHDLNGKVYTGPYISIEDQLKIRNYTSLQVVLNGRGTWLGKGYSGCCYQGLGSVVKVSTTVGYHPDVQQQARTVDEAITTIHNEYQVSQILLAHKIPGILPTQYLQVGQKAFLIRPYCDLPKPGQLTFDQCMMVADTIRKMHRHGYVYQDMIEVGLWNGLPYLFDLGLVEKATKAKKDRIRSDIERLAMFFKTHGVILPWAERRRALLAQKVEAFEKLMDRRLAKGLPL